MQYPSSSFQIGKRKIPPLAAVKGGIGDLWTHQRGRTLYAKNLLVARLRPHCGHCNVIFTSGAALRPQPSVCPFGYSSVSGSFFGHTCLSRNATFHRAVSAAFYTLYGCRGRWQSLSGRSSPIHTQHNNRSRPSPGIRTPNGHRSALFVELPLWCS